MQYLIRENFIFPLRKRFLGGMHKVAGKRQMFFCQNHPLSFAKKVHKIEIYHSNIMGLYAP